MRRGQIEIAARGLEDCLLLLRVEPVASGVRKMMGLERFENCVADVGLRGDCRSWRVALFVDFLDQAFSILNQVVVLAIRHARRNPRKKPLDGAFLSRICLGEFFPRELNVDVARPGQPQRRRQINREQL